MILIENKINSTGPIGIIVLGVGLCMVLFFVGDLQDWAFVGILGLFCIIGGLYVLFSSTRGKLYLIHEQGITLYKKKKVYHYKDLGYYMHRTNRSFHIPHSDTSHWIHIYDQRKKEIFVLYIPEEINPQLVIDFLSKHLKKY